MPLKPVPTRPAGPRGRSTTLAALAPVAVLAVVVVVAWAGAVAEAVTPPRDGRSIPTPATSARPARDEVPIAPGIDEAAVPRVAFRLPVATVEETLARRHAGEIGGGLVAVAGYLTVDPEDLDCRSGDMTPSGAFCQRSAILAAGADPILTVNWTENGGSAPRLGTPRPHLHPQILPGTALPPELVSRPDPRVRERVPVAVVVIGRFDDPRARDCQPGRRHCGEEFVLERVAWANGEWLNRPLVRDPAVPVSEAALSSELRRVLTSRESDRGEIILSQALLTVDRLRDVDPAAAAALADGLGGPVWYVRSVGRLVVDAGERRVAWAVLDGGSGLVLATSPPG